MLRKLFLPYFHTLGIRVFTVINAQAIAKHSLQALHHLHGKRYFGQQIEHLLMLIQCLLYQVDINLGFTARGNTMQQRHVFLQKRELYLVKRFLLYIAQRFDMFRMRVATKVQSTHLFIIGFQHTTLHQGVYRLQGVSLVNQLVAGYLELFFGLS